MGVHRIVSRKGALHPLRQCPSTLPTWRCATSTLTTVADSSLSVNVWTMWATHSHPTFVDSVLVRRRGLFHHPIVLATRRLKMSPLTPPSSFRSAVMRHFSPTGERLLWPNCQSEQFLRIPINFQKGSNGWRSCPMGPLQHLVWMTEVQEEGTVRNPTRMVVGTCIHIVLKGGTPRDREDVCSRLEIGSKCPECPVPPLLLPEPGVQKKLLPIGPHLRQNCIFCARNNNCILPGILAPALKMYHCAHGLLGIHPTSN